MENPISMDDLGVPPFMETHISWKFHVAFIGSIPFTPFYINMLMLILDDRIYPPSYVHDTVYPLKD